MWGERVTRVLLERERELDLLDGALEGAVDGSGSVTLVRGPAGIGKSELLAVARSRAADMGATVVAARGGEFERSFGFGVARQLFEPVLTDAAPAERVRLLGGAAELALPAISLSEAGSQPDRHSVQIGDPAAPIQHGLYWLVANLAERAPLLISVDDLQWSDAESARWLLYLARRVSDLPVAVVAALRSGEPGLDPELVGAIEREPACRMVEPEALTAAASAELVRAELGTDADEEFCAACQRASGGNPFLLRELIEAVRSEEVAPTAGSVGQIMELRPGTVSRSVTVRLGRLSAEAAAVTRAVAVLGDRAHPSRVVELAELEPDEVAEAAGVLAEAAILAPGETLSFAHPLIRTAIYSEMPAAERARAHLRAARIIREAGASPEEVAAQLLYAEPGGDSDAVPVLRAAAQRALARAAPEAAKAYLRRAFAEPIPPGERKMVLAELLVAAGRGGDLFAFEGISDDPVAEISDSDESFRAAGPMLVAWLFLQGRLEEMEPVMRRGIENWRRDGEDALALRYEVLSFSILDVKPRDAVARLDTYADRLEPGTYEQRAWFAMRGWWQHFVGGQASESVDLVRQGLDTGQLLDVENLGPVFTQAVLVLLRADELDQAEHWIDVLAADAHHREPAYAAAFLGLRSVLAHRRGELRASEVDAKRAVDLCREQKVLPPLAINLRWLLDILIDRGELEAAQDEIAISGLDGDLPSFYWFAPLRFGRARLRIAQGRAEESLDDLHEVLDLWDATRPASDPIASTLALALHSLGRDPDEVRRLLDRELEAAREWGTPRGIGVALRAQGLVEGGDRGIDLLAESVGALRSSPARLELALSLTELGSALRRANRRTVAREPLREALELASRCGATPLAERAREELAATGAKPRRVMLSGVESLTPSELRVARLAAAGMGNREIAQQLFVSVKTVETHLGSAYRKLDISSRGELPGALSE